MKEYRILGNVEFSNVDLTLEKRTVVDTSSAIKVLVASSSLLSLLQLSTFSAEEDTVYLLNHEMRTVVPIPPERSV